MEHNPKDFANLALKTQYNDPHFNKGSKGLKHLEKFFSWLVPRAKETGTVKTFYFDGKLQAYFLRLNTVNPMNKKKGTNIHSTYNPRSQKALRWWKKTLREELKKCPVQALFHMSNFHMSHQKFINTLGFHIDCVQIIGQLNYSILQLQRRDLQKYKDGLRKRGLKIRKLTNEKWAAPLANVVVEEFKKRPWHCRFAAHDEYKKVLAKRFRDYAKAPYSKAHKNSNVWVVLKGNKPLGTFSSTVFEDGLLGKMGGMGFELGEELQGIGLGLIAYETMFKWLKKKDVKRYQGYSSNPAVLYLAREFKRRPAGWHFRKGKPHYPASHFKI